MTETSRGSLEGKRTGPEGNLCPELIFGEEKSEKNVNRSPGNDVPRHDGNERRHTLSLHGELFRYAGMACLHGK